MPEVSLEVIIERWNNADGSIDYLWSVWHAGRRVHMGGKFPSADAAKSEAVTFCRASFGVAPERVREL
ncbi:MAG: hypothetical protein ACFCUQ_07640 [Kiloniellales bacterium]